MGWPCLLSTHAIAFDTCPFFFFKSTLKPVLHSFFCAALSGFPLSWCPCPWLSSNPTKSPVPTGRTIVKTLLPWDSDESPEASPGPPGPRRGAGAGGPREEVGATPGPEEQDSLLLQRKSARRCVKQRPSYDVFEDSDDSEPGGPPAPRRRTPREHELPMLEPEEQSRPRKPTLQPVLQLKARRRLDKVSTARSENPKPCVRHGSCSPGATWML